MKKKILIFVGIGLVVAVTVFVVLFFMNRITGYGDAKYYTDEILSTKDSMVAFLDAKITEKDYDDELSDKQKSMFDALKQAMEKCDSMMKNIGDKDVMRDEEVTAKYDEAATKFENMRKAFDVELYGEAECFDK